jgi:hypothetical protein
MDAAQHYGGGLSIRHYVLILIDKNTLPSLYPPKSPPLDNRLLAQ